MLFLFKILLVILLNHKYTFKKCTIVKSDKFLKFNKNSNKLVLLKIFNYLGNN